MIEWLEHSSKAIKGFPMGDPHERRFPVYLPPEYDKSRKEPYPVVFFLAGWGGRASKYISDSSLFEVPLDQQLDEAIANNEIPPLIGVFPDGSSKLGCSQYVNSPAFGNYMDYICDELTEFIDENYNTHKSPDFRGIAGHSSGGFGSLLCGMMRSDKFRYVCSSAGDSFFELTLIPTLVPTLNQVNKAGGVKEFIDKFFDSPNPGSHGRDKFMSLLTLSLAPCYAPNVAKPPLYGDLFYDLKTGEIDQEVFQKYLNWDPVHVIDRHLEMAQDLKFVHLECGTEDEYAPQYGHRQLANKLKKYNIKHQVDEYPGRHGGHHWRYKSRVELMLKKMFS
jgi:enterochelin esterase family protein